MSTSSPDDPARAELADGSSPDSGEPTRFGNYLILTELGRGAQGVVFLAEDATLHRKVALKMLSSVGAQSPAVRDRFKREAHLTSKLDHPGICGVHDVGEVDGLPYIAMQYVRGTTLASLVEKARGGEGGGADETRKGSDTITIAGGGSKGGIEDVLRLVERAARALHVAHEAGLVHRDIKPANIMVTPEGHPVLLDFGLARDLEAEGQTLTQSGQILGTPAYLAPEQIVALRGKVDRRTDIYALGVTLFECVTLKRPFESSTWDQLFHEILNGAPRNPRHLNARIPIDLATVIEVAMDRDPTRRYPTAEALAEDLRRIRSFEPIQAKAAGPITRVFKWSRRNPGRAVGAAAALLFVLGSLGFVAVRMIQRGRDLREYLRSASAALVAADYVAAAVAVAKAQELDPESAQVLELKAEVVRGRDQAERELERKKALAGAEQARAEALRLGANYESARTRIDELEAQLLKEETGVFARYADEMARAAFADRQRDLHSLKIDAERLLFAHQEALENASRLEAPWGGASTATQSALATFFLERWREALLSRDTVRAAAMRTAVELHDTRGALREELLGRGTLTLEFVPSSADVYLFRWEDYSSMRTSNVIPRLVPVPTTGLGHVREGAWVAAFHPGDPCLVVVSVAPGSIAADAGLSAGDLVIAIGGESAADAVFVHEVAANGCLARAGIEPLTRVREVNGVQVLSLYDWNTQATVKQGEAVRMKFAGRSDSIECDPRSLSVLAGVDLVEHAASAAARLTCLRRGELVTFELSAGQVTGLRCDTTAYPLVLSEHNRIAAGAAHVMDPGSYLLLARGSGYEDQRFNVVVGRREDTTARIELLPTGSTPEGFVYVPPGPFRAGGDTAAFRPREEHSVDMPGFWLANKELTNAEWYEFVNDPLTLKKISEAKPGEHLYLPQDDRVMAARDEASGEYVWDVYSATSASSPVLGLAWTDVRDFLAWRNAGAEQRGEAWRYDLPSENEWEKAARGVDGRTFPWGNRFDPSLVVCRERKDDYLLDAPGGFEPRDESPFGVRDMAGSREEWLRDANEETPPRYRKRGGYWGSAVEQNFRSASRMEASPERFASSQGVRLVARNP